MKIRIIFKKKEIYLIWLFLNLTLLSCHNIDSSPEKTDPTVIELKVGLYPYVPRFKQFVDVLNKAWVEPGVKLTILNEDQWNGGYNADPGTDPSKANFIDVFVFDAMFISDFQKKGILNPLQPNEIDNFGDFLSYAIKGVKDKKKDIYYAIPLLGCANILFYRKSDKNLAKANTLTDINKEIGQCSYTSQIPPDSRGLMVNLKGGTTKASYFVDALHDIEETYPLILPQNAADLKKGKSAIAISNLKKVMAMASYYNSNTDLPEEQSRAKWFSQGYGRALIGYTESLADMSTTTRANIDFKLLPLADGTVNPLLYSDVIGINSGTKKRALALKLANLMAATNTIVNSIKPDISNAPPQYLIPVRKTAFQDLKQIDPLYEKIQNVIFQKTLEPILFDLTDARSWLKNMEKPISSQITSLYPCGCDKPANGVILNNNDAKLKCPKICGSAKDWSGQWTNQFPAASTKNSVCGCKTCPVN